MLLLSIEMVFNSNDWEEHFVLPDDLQSKSACKCMVVLVARLLTVVLEAFQHKCQYRSASSPVGPTANATADLEAECLIHTTYGLL